MRAATVGYVAAARPQLAGHRLKGDDGIDGTALRFLVRKVLEENERRQEEEKKKTARTSASSVPKRTRKKSIKRRLPRGVRIHSRSSLSRAQCSLLLSTGLKCSASWRPYVQEGQLHALRRLWQWQVLCWFGWLRCTSRLVPLHHVRFGPEGQYSSFARRQPWQWHVHGWFYW